MRGIPIKSLIAATIVKTILAICSSTIGVNAASRLAIRSGVLIPPVALMAAHISNIVASASNPNVMQVVAGVLGLHQRLLLMVV